MNAVLFVLLRAVKYFSKSYDDDAESNEKFENVTSSLLFKFAADIISISKVFAFKWRSFLSKCTLISNFNLPNAVNAAEQKKTLNG